MPNPILKDNDVFFHELFPRQLYKLISPFARSMHYAKQHCKYTYFYVQEHWQYNYFASDNSF